MIIAFELAILAFCSALIGFLLSYIIQSGMAIGKVIKLESTITLLRRRLRHLSKENKPVSRGSRTFALKTR